MVICPKCKRSLESSSELYNTENWGETYVDYVNGYCSHCNKWYMWEEIYTFSGIENFQEVKEGD